MGLDGWDGGEEKRRGKEGIEQLLGLGSEQLGTWWAKGIESFIVGT